MGQKKGNNYFQMLLKNVGYACKAADLLLETFQNYDSANIIQNIEKMHQLEHEGDLAKHELMEKLYKEFLPPIEREDIIALASAIDDVTDSLEDVLLRAYMFRIQSIRQDAIDFAQIVIRCCNALQDVFQEFHNFRKSSILREQLIKINNFEEEGDKLYYEVIHRLYGENDPVSVLSWTFLYEHLEDCCDSCEHVADIVETVIQKNL